MSASTKRIRHLKRLDFPNLAFVGCGRKKKPALRPALKEDGQGFGGLGDARRTNNAFAWERFRKKSDFRRKHDRCPACAAPVITGMDENGDKHDGAAD
jgi:hypothetical protein